MTNRSPLVAFSESAASIVRTKIVATVGPACRSEHMIEELIRAGVDVFRINMAHGSIAEHEESLTRIRGISESLFRPVGVLVDLAGPKIRLGELPNGAVECIEGDLKRFVRGTCSNSPEEFVTTYERLVDELSVGDSVMLADGTISLVVESRSTTEATCRVIQSGTVRSRQGVNLPGAKLSVQAMSPVDWQHAEWAATVQADFVSLSFVRTAVEVRLLKELLRTHGSRARVVAKIEKREAIDNLSSIVDAADVVMVARGDLGVEVDVAVMPMLQKKVVTMCQRYQKPVIVATQMLDSMQHSRRPTRAEATDVANAILDGCDACMLSGETAIGEHPRLTVEMMRRIAMATEAQYLSSRSAGGSTSPEVLVEGLHPITQAVVDGASKIAGELDARLIVVASRSGITAQSLSKLRSGVPTIGVSDNVTTLRQMALYWGVTPLAGVDSLDANQLLDYVSSWGLREGRLTRGDRILLVAGIGFGTGGHNMALVHEV